MSNDVFKQNSFSRSLANERKMGAYYTDLDHCRRIGNLFSFPDDQEVCVLEPSIGDGSAVLSVLNKCNRNNIKIFGVELNPGTYDSIKESGKFDYLINADFLNGVKISHSSFSFCFANPPYGNDKDSGKRLESLFIDKMYHYISNNGLLALVIPYYVLVDESFLKGFFSRYQPIAEFKFDDNVYSEFKQIVVIAIKRPSIGYLKQTYDIYLEKVNSIDKLPYLPFQDPDQKLIVPPSKESSIEYFTTLLFDKKAAASKLKYSALYPLMTERIFVPSYCATELGQPPIPLKKDLLYLCAISGGGQGLVGSEENRDLHLQRGVAKVVKEIEEREVNGQPEIVEKSFTKICLNVIENDGLITTLE